MYSTFWSASDVGYLSRAMRTATSIRLGGKGTAKVGLEFESALSILGESSESVALRRHRSK